MLKNNNKSLNYLVLTPICLYKHIEREDGLIDVLVPRFRDKFFGKIFQPLLRYKYINANLDEIGSEVWKHIDGKTPANDMIESLNLKFGEKIAPAEERLKVFLEQLYKNKFIDFIELKKELV